MTELWSLQILGGAVSHVEPGAPNPLPRAVVFEDQYVLALCWPYAGPMLTLC